MFKFIKSIFIREAINDVYQDNLYQSLRDLEIAEEHAEAWIARRDMLLKRVERLRSQITPEYYQ